MIVNVLAAAAWAPVEAPEGPWRRFHTGTDTATLGAGWLLPRLVGRATAVTRLIAEVAGTAMSQAGLDSASVAVVTGSAGGERTVAAGLLDAVASGRSVSALGFQHSVHNTAAAYLSMSTGNRRPMSAIAAGADTVAMTLIEAATTACAQRCQVVAAFADEAHGDVPPFAAALVMTADTTSRGLACVELGRRDEAPAWDAGGLTGNPSASAIALLDALAERRTGPVALTAGTSGRTWTARLVAGHAGGDTPDHHQQQTAPAQQAGGGI